MAYRFTRQRVRLGIDVGVKRGLGALQDRITGEGGQFARSAGVQFEIALLYNNQVIDISNVLDAVLEIKATNDPDAALAMTKTIGAASMNRGLTDAEWETGEASKCHFLFTFSSTEAAESVFGTPADTEDHWLVLWGHTDDDSVDKDVFGVGSIKTFDAGISGAVVSPPAAEGGVTLTQLGAMMQDFIKRVNEPGVSITLVSQATQQRVKLYADDNGDFATDTQVTT